MKNLPQGRTIGGGGSAGGFMNNDSSRSYLWSPVAGTYVSGVADSGGFVSYGGNPRMVQTDGTKFVLQNQGDAELWLVVQAIASFDALAGPQNWGLGIAINNDLVGQAVGSIQAAAAGAIPLSQDFTASTDDTLHVTQRLCQLEIGDTIALMAAATSGGTISASYVTMSYWQISVTG